MCRDHLKTKDVSPLARYTPIRCLRKTLYGEAILCRDELQQKQVVLKRIELQALEDNTCGGHENPLQEAEIIRLLQHQPQFQGPHQNIVSYEQSSSAMFVEHGNIYIVMEFCSGGDLYDHVEQQTNNRLSEEETLKIIYQVASGLSFLHANNVAHRDLSLENVLLDGKGQAKICDFGLSCRADQRYKDIVGKLYYMAPEVVMGREYDPKAADIWSLGIMCFCLLTGSPLIAEEELRIPTLRVVHKYGISKILEMWGMIDVISEPTLDILSQMLQLNPARRPTIEYVLEHLRQ